MNCEMLFKLKQMNSLFYETSTITMLFKLKIYIFSYMKLNYNNAVATHIGQQL